MLNPTVGIMSSLNWPVCWEKGGVRQAENVECNSRANVKYTDMEHLQLSR